VQQIKYALRKFRLKLVSLREYMLEHHCLRYFVINCCCKSLEDLKKDYKQKKTKEIVLKLGLKKEEQSRKNLKDRLKCTSNEPTDSSSNYTFD
jgi:hypothetical protein